MTTTQTQHTPGPWKHEYKLVSDGYEILSDEREIMGYIKNIHNARMAAAAPELLQACKDSLRKWDEYVINSGDDNTELMNFIGDLRTVIAKAEGTK